MNNTMRSKGVEPSRAEAHNVLSVARLPLRHDRAKKDYLTSSALSGIRTRTEMGLSHSPLPIGLQGRRSFVVLPWTGFEPASKRV